MRLRKIAFVLVFVFTLTSTISAQTYREFVALVEVYRNTKGYNWTESWDLNTPMTAWKGVTIKDGHVVGLDLSNNNLEGKIPLTLVNLKHLKHLDLSGNKLKGRLPGGIGRMTQLYTFNVSSNGLTGRIPRGFAKLSKLKSLQLANNNFEDFRGLEEIKKHQLVFFDMNSDFKHLQLLSLKSQNVRMANLEYEDIE
ncbi:leucine-rich repeat domain-containing protein [Allomuricauda sp. SCSIO 65647]|uniref:leucine-rich repeat domain-containing protein n=1 Tax=Allomuricauda sp. SCSIO 65647 TaxID=2908843 RepID=UPI001F3619E6|nr:leucine-rich repeat domain-containing protein [Muricauda sp. SCSIO 65647]UJH66464.1 leucine-rich repeat domain-containing protein [Muricauda sp. SCSIO 65647]